jgi:hypothetical protein
MGLTKKLLMAVIVILLIVTICDCRAKGKTGDVATYDCINRSSGEVTQVKVATPHGSMCQCAKCASPEARAASENLEHFSQCPGPNEVKAALGCGEDDNYEYAANDFGAPGLDFKDWVTSQSVDTQVIQNHANFVKDRLGNDSQNITGRTYAMGELESDQVTWVGIRGRPQAVPVCNPTQVADVNYDWYSAKPKITWSSV